MTDVLLLLLTAPLLGAAVVAALPRNETGLARGIGLGTSGVTLGLIGVVWRMFDPAVPGIQFEHALPWIAELGVSLHVGLDGVSLPFVTATVVLTPVAMLAGWRIVAHRMPGFVVATLVLEALTLGAFVAQDAVLFVACTQLTTFPLLFIGAVWGGAARLAAGVRMLAMTLLSTVAMLVPVLVLGVAHYGVTAGRWSFDVQALADVVLVPTMQTWCFWAFACGCFVRVPLWPLHNWLCHAYAQLPVPVVVLLFGAVTKLGVYGLLRFAFPLFPLAAGDSAQPLAWIVGLGACVAAVAVWRHAQPVRVVVGWAVVHMAIVVLGMCSMSVQGLTGAVFTAVVHGFAVSGLVLLLAFARARRGDGGRPGPWLVASVVLVACSLAGVPGLAGFAGELLATLGVVRHSELMLQEPDLVVLLWVLSAAVTAYAGLGLLRTQVWPNHASLARHTDSAQSELPCFDMSLKDILTIGPLVLAMVGLGLHPQPLVSRIEPAAVRVVERFNLRRCAAIRHAGAQHPVKLDELRERCSDPETFMRALYGVRR